MNLTEKQKDLLILLAQEGLKTRYDLFKRKRDGAEKRMMSSSTAHRVINDLKKAGLIEVKREEAFRIRGRKKKLYGLTFKGLLAALLQPKSWKDIDQIAKQQGKLLPLILGKWRHFRRSGVNEIQLQKALRWLCFVAQQQRYENPQFLMRDFFMYVVNMTRIKERVFCFRGFDDDRELSKWVNEEEWSFLIYAAALVTSFRLIRDPDPDWDNACKEFRRINRTPVTEKMKEMLEEELLEQLGNLR